MRFLIVLHKDKDSEFGVTVPDLPGCFSAGATTDEALAMAKEAIEGHIEVLLEEGHALPETQDSDVHIQNPEYAGGIWYFVDTNPVALLGKTARYNLTLPEQLVNLVDQYLDTHPTAYRSRSDFFAHLAADHLLQR